MNQEIQLYTKIQDPLDFIERTGTFIAQSGMFGCERREQGMVLAMACVTEGRSPLEIKRRYHLLNGELSMRADAMLAELRARGGRHKILSRTDEKAAIQITYDGETQTFAFSWAEAKAEPFVYARDGKSIKTNYATPWQRKKMLWARLVSDAVHAMAPEVATGIYTPEELEETPATTNQHTLLEPRAAQELKPANVIDIQAQPQPDPVPAPAHENKTPPPPPPAKTAATSAPAAPDPHPPRPVAKVDPKTGRLTLQTVQALEAAITDQHSGPALQWLEQEKWIPPMGNLQDLSLHRARAILKNPPAFLQHIGAAPAPAPAPKN